MATKPYQSKLIPYEEEIMKLRRRRPPTAYAHIAEILQLKYNLVIHRSAICKFIKIRKGGGRKVYTFYTNPADKKSVQPAIQRVHTATNSQIQQPKPKFEFTYRERYNLKRLPPEEAAAIRKKLEEEGH